MIRSSGKYREHYWNNIAVNRAGPIAYPIVNFFSGQISRLERRDFKNVQRGGRQRFSYTDG